MSQLRGAVGTAGTLGGFPIPGTAVTRPIFAGLLLAADEFAETLELLHRSMIQSPAMVLPAAALHALLLLLRIK